MCSAGRHMGRPYNRVGSLRAVAADDVISSTLTSIGLATVATAPSACARFSISIAPDITAIGTLATVGSPSCAPEFVPAEARHRQIQQDEAGTSGARRRTVRSR